MGEKEWEQNFLWHLAYGLTWTWVLQVAQLQLARLCPFHFSGCLWVYTSLQAIGAGTPSWVGMSPQDLSMGLSKGLGSRKCHGHRDPNTGMSLSPKPLLPLHSRCPLSGTHPNQGQSLVHSLPKYLQHPYWISGTARDPAARPMPTAYSGGHSYDSSCLSSQGQTEACPVLSVPGFYLLSHLSQYQTLPHASPLSQTKS